MPRGLRQQLTPVCRGPGPAAGARHWPEPGPAPTWRPGKTWVYLLIVLFCSSSVYYLFLSNHFCKTVAHNLEWGRRGVWYQSLTLSADSRGILPCKLPWEGRYLMAANSELRVPMVSGQVSEPSCSTYCLNERTRDTAAPRGVQLGGGPAHIAKLF